MIKTKLRPHQIEAVERALSFDGFALFPEPRVGKTLIALTIVDRREPDRLLILCPDVAIGEWEKQIAEHTDFEWNPEIQIMTYQSAMQTSRRRRLNNWLKKGQRSMTILDEGHVIKKRARRFARTSRGFGDRSKYRLILTGTPLSQGLQDGFSLMRFVDREVFGKDWDVFQERYLKMGGYFNRKVVGYRNEEEFKEKFHSRSYRITFKESLAGKKRLMVRRRKIYQPMSPPLREHYDNLQIDLETYVNRHKRVRVKMVAQMTMKLQQLTGGWLIDEDGESHQVSTEKVDMLTRWVNIEWSPKPEPFIVVCRFLHEINYLESALTRAGLDVQVICGGRKLQSDMFDCVILQIQSGLAIDLSRAKTVIFYSWDYSFVNFEQTRFRILSYSQTRVNYVFLMVSGSVDDVMYEVVTKKKKLAEAVCDHFRRGYD